MSGAITPLPQYAFMAWCLVKAQGQLYLLPLPVMVMDYKHSSSRNIFTVIKLRKMN
jgi:hypothetical protein